HFHLRQALLKIIAHHFLHVHEQAESLADKVVIAIHCPGHRGLISLRLEGENSWIGRRKWLDELEFDLYQLARFAFGDCHPAFADIAVAGPAVDSAVPGGSAFEA